MYKFFFRFAVTVVTILTANLAADSITSYLVSYRFQARPVPFTLIAMGIIAIIFYPLFRWMEKWIEQVSGKLIKKGNSLAGRYAGLFLVFFLAMAILTWLYARKWYHIDLLRALFDGSIGSYF